MAINANVLSFVAGAAEQFTKTKDELKKELRENKRRQRDWMNTYGSKVLTESKQKEEAVTSALKELESRGLAQPDVLQLMQRHGVDAVLELQKYVKDYENTNSTRVDKDLINKVWKAADDFTLTSDNYGDAVSKVFGTNKVASTTPVIQEAEDRNFFDILKRNLSGDVEDEELQDFLSDATEGIGGKSINELRRMAASSPSMLGTEGAAVFDRSALRGSEPSAGEVRLWKNTTNIIVREELKNLSPADRRAVGKRENANLDFVDRDTDDIFFDLADPDGVYFEAFSEATRKVHEQNPFSNNRAAIGAYGGQDALDAILNPPPPPEPLTPEEKAEQLEQDLIDNNLTEARPEDLGESTDVQVGEYFRDNNKDFVISNGELVGRPEDAPFDESKVVELPPTELPVEEGTYNTDDLTLKVQPTVAPEGIPERPEPIYRGEEKKLLEKPRNKRAIDDWDDQYGDKYNPDATYKIVRPQGPRPEDINSREYYEYELWDATYGDTHDPRTGYPLIEDLDMTLIPNSEVAD